MVFWRWMKMQDENECNYRMESEYVRSATAGRRVCGRGKRQISYVLLAWPSRPSSKLRCCASALGPPSQLDCAGRPLTGRSTSSTRIPFPLLANHILPAQSRWQCRSWCGRRTMACCTAGNAICCYIQIHRWRSCI